jgi:hypothetical protein
MSLLSSRLTARLALFIGTVLLATLIACQSEGPGGATPVPTIQAPSLVPQEVPMTTLLRNPASFEGQTVWLTGQYQSLPLLVCGDGTHRSPATWALTFGDVQTLVSGFDDKLRPLAAAGLSLTVEGRWQKWEGPVGCGRRAPNQEIWYLSAARIVSPNPLVRTDDNGVIVLVPSPTPDTELPQTPTGDETPAEFPTQPPDEEETPEPEEEEFPTAAPPPTFQTIPTPAPGATNTPRPTNTPDTGGNETGTPTLSATPSPTGGTPGTGTAETGTPTVTATAGSPAATAQPSDQGTMTFDSVEKQVLAANTPHRWQFSPPADEPIIITVGAGLNLNVSLDLVAPDGTVVAKADLAGAGQPETINFTTPNPTGQYQIIVSGVSGSSGPYVLVLFDSLSEPVVVMRDTLTYGSGGSGTIPEGVDHFWNFEGQAGDVISIEVSPSGNTGDLLFYLIGPDGSELEFVDQTVGGSESLLNFTLPQSGFYSIGIGEYDFLMVSYTMTLTQ